MARTSIDFSKGLSAKAVKQRNEGGQTSQWVTQLNELLTAVKDERAEYDTLYQIGSFENSSGAQTAIRNTRRREDLPDAKFNLQAVVVDVRDEDGAIVTKVTSQGNTVNVRHSELWASVMSDEAVAALNGEDPDSQGEGEDDDEDAEDAAPAAAPKRTRKPR